MKIIQTNKFIIFLSGIVLGYVLHILIDSPGIWYYEAGSTLGFRDTPIVKINKITHHVYVRAREGWVRLRPDPPLPGDSNFKMPARVITNENKN